MVSYFAHFAFLFSRLFLAGSVLGSGSNCSSSRDHVDPVSLKFISECSYMTYCSAAQNGTCLPRLCRRDEFPFGYSEKDALPPLCPAGTFCPDEGSGCWPLATVGGACQLNRDEQCAPPGTSTDPTSDLYGSLCLKSICMYTNRTLGQPCIAENTTYQDSFNGQQYTNTIIRDNCMAPDYYCGQVSMVCEAARALRYPCQAQEECTSRNCDRGFCADPPEAPLKIQSWQYSLTAVCIIGVLVVTVMLLALVHKRNRLQHYRALREYYDEQLGLRRAIVSLHSAAAFEVYSDKTL
ncbi:uncharacterized protein EV420DRAFT_1257048 [Desarmillaria tabescens]|uniref:Dickkopf N-terminal cysteine-rich domain-containing protein n=1 Tax=Armillaria tabescens TaxID=1929756 RepID=A0AA39TT80_ARMTA|nr:uncharacterized protein EV420DRAFT_1257048 [Desarmillaria tabescens]KAK0469437.1 hypothetical protein EV420DRAFT_1257048 [Desarmillaria tabescens]